MRVRFPPPPFVILLSVAHPLKNRIAIDVDVNPATGWGGGLPKLANVILKDNHGTPTGQKVTGVLFDPRQPWCTKDFIDYAHTLFPVVGIRYVPAGWDDTLLSPEVAAKKGSDYISALENDGKRRIDVVEWDVELHDAANDYWCTKFLLGYKKADGTVLKGIRGAGGKLPNPADPSTLGYRWGRPGVWTMEGRQDASTGPIQAAANSGLLVGPQCYYGDMSGPPLDPNFEARTWVLNDNPERPNGAKIDPHRFYPYYDANRQCRPLGISETVLFATSRLTELFE